MDTLSIGKDQAAEAAVNAQLGGGKPEVNAAATTETTAVTTQVEKATGGAKPTEAAATEVKTPTTPELPQEVTKALENAKALFGDRDALMEVVNKAVLEAVSKALPQPKGDDALARATEITKALQGAEGLPDGLKDAVTTITNLLATAQGQPVEKAAPAAATTTNPVEVEKAGAALSAKRKSQLTSAIASLSSAMKVLKEAMGDKKMPWMKSEKDEGGEGTVTPTTDPVAPVVDAAAAVESVIATATTTEPDATDDEINAIKEVTKAVGEITAGLKAIGERVAKVEGTVQVSKSAGDGSGEGDASGGTKGSFWSGVV